MEQRLAYLFDQYYHNRSSQEELEEFFHYVERAAHDEELQQLMMQAYAKILRQHPSQSTIDEKGMLKLSKSDWLNEASSVEALKRPQGKKRKNLLPALGIAASLFLCLVGAMIYLSTLQDTPSPQQAHVRKTLVKDYTTKGQQKYYLLSDSSQIWLNVASNLSYAKDFGGRSREVWLEGEAFFDVKQVKDKPFVIHVKGGSILVLGTAFNVKAYAGTEKVRVSVREGKVRVQIKNYPATLLGMGEEATFGESREVKQQIRQVSNIKQVGAWQNGLYKYEDVPLAEIVADLERIYDCQILIEGSTLQQELVNTSFKQNESLNGILEILANVTGSYVTKKENKYSIHQPN